MHEDMFQSNPRLGAVPKKVKQALDFSIEVSDLIEAHHPELVPVDRPQVSVAMALFMLSLDHRQAVLLLIAHGARSSAAAMIRPTFEAYYRGMWALKVATTEQIENIFSSTPRIPTLDTILQQMRKNTETSHLADYDSWKAAGDYIHSGPLQLSRWLATDSIGPRHPHSDAIDMLELSDFCGLLTCIGMNEIFDKNPPELHEMLLHHQLRRGTRAALAAYYGSDYPELPLIRKIAIALTEIAKLRVMSNNSQ